MLLQVIRRYGEITAAGPALETWLSVEEADRMLSELAVRDHLEVSLEHSRLVSALIGERDAPPLGVWRSGGPRAYGAVA